MPCSGTPLEQLQGPGTGTRVVSKPFGGTSVDLRKDVQAARGVVGRTQASGGDSPRILVALESANVEAQVGSGVSRCSWLRQVCCSNDDHNDNKMQQDDAFCCNTGAKNETVVGSSPKAHGGNIHLTL